MLFRVLKIILISFAVRFHSVTDRFPRCSFQERLAAFFSWPYWAWLAHVSAVSTETNYCCRPVVALVTLQRAYSSLQTEQKFREVSWTPLYLVIYIPLDLFFFFSFQFILYFLIQGRGGSHMYYIYRNKILVVTIYDRISIVHFISKNNHYCFSVILFFFFLVARLR